MMMVWSLALLAAVAAPPKKPVAAALPFFGKVKQVTGGGMERRGECWVKDGKVRIEWEDGKKHPVSIYDGRKCYHFDATEKRIREFKHDMEAHIPWLSIYKPEFGEKQMLGTEKIDGLGCQVVQFINDRSYTVKEWISQDHPALVLRQEISFEGQIENGTYISSLVVNGPCDDALFAPPADGVHYLVGGPAPDFKLTPYNASSPMELKSFKGKKPVLLNFFATWCLPCKHETPDFVKVYGEYKDRVEFISIDVFEKPEDGDVKTLVTKFVEEYKVPWPILMDEKGAGGKPNVSDRLYDAMALPVNVGVDAKGIVRFHRRGATTEAQLKDELNKLLGTSPAP